MKMIILYVVFCDGVWKTVYTKFWCLKRYNSVYFDFINYDFSIGIHK